MIDLACLHMPDCVCKNALYKFHLVGIRYDEMCDHTINHFVLPSKS